MARSKQQALQSQDPPKKKRGGCLRAIAVLILVGVIVVVIAAIFAPEDDEPSLHTLQGEVLIMNPVNFEVVGDTCRGIGSFTGIEEGATMTVTPANGSAIEVPLSAGVISSEGNCGFVFTPDIPESESYTFAVAEQSQERLDRTISKGLPDGWDRGGEPEDWWVSIQYDTN
jgi:hypothetical protein